MTRIHERNDRRGTRGLAAMWSVAVLAGCLTGPTDQDVYEGQPASFDVRASTGRRVTYQWYRDGIAIPVAGTSARFTTFPTTLLDDGAVFQVVVTTPDGAIDSREAALHLRPS